VAFDSQGHIFTANLTTTSCTTKPRRCETAGGGYSWWEQGASQSAHIEVSNAYDGVFNYLDVDHSGNLYIDGATALGSGTSQVYEVTNPASTSWNITTIIPATSDQLGGIYVSNAGTTLNVVDETARTIPQYALPWIVGETPFNVLGPTDLKKNEGRPISGGFNERDSRLALGDENSTFDLGFVAQNMWTRSGNKKLGNVPVFGAAFVPSDK
jgi:hypothetical protein